ncbi:MAG TPA: carboxypeptidase-like regulatory domain-containing protein [Saprospiraceae bacterium]|nr:carboxypeptidase-like regulatory domain-containing protein [Saprospiraceae bacterium]
MKNSILILVISYLTFFCSCSKEKLNPNQGGNFKSNILGIVTDEFNMPVKGASIIFNGVVNGTDKNGIYVFNDVDVNSFINLITIRKIGYFDTYRSFNVQKASTLQLRNILLKKEFKQSFQTATGGSISGNNYEIKFPADAIIMESTELTYTGQVNVAVKYLNPDDNATYDEMPGELTGITSSNTITKLSTFGMLIVELESPSGQKLQIKSGKEAEISVKAPASSSIGVPNTVPLWYFDVTNAYWKEEGSAELINGRYVGKVAHFSCWNYDVKLPSIILKGRVLDQHGNPLNCNIGFTAPGEYGGHGSTDYDGNFSGRVSKDKLLDAYIGSYGNCPTYSSFKTGPFSEDFTLPDIFVDIVPDQYLNLSGSYFDCSGKAIQKGYLIIDQDPLIRYFPINNGQASVNIENCIKPAKTIVTVVDMLNLQESDPINLNGSGTYNLGIRFACGNTLDYISIKNVYSTVNKVFTDFYLNGESNEKNLIWGDYKYFRFDDSNNTPNTFIKGHFPIKEAQNSESSYTIKYNLISGWVNITQGGKTGDTILGDFNIIMKNQKTQELELFTGSFQKKI